MIFFKVCMLINTIFAKEKNIEVNSRDSSFNLVGAECRLCRNPPYSEEFGIRLDLIQIFIRFNLIFHGVWIFIVLVNYKMSVKMGDAMKK